jgi:molybdopterin/thiamine biosynthesis adenylyltransferase
MELYRTDNLIDLETLKKHTLALVGQGSLGSLLTSLVAYPWGKIILIDPNKLKIENVERHLLGKSQVGKYKVDAMKEWLVDRGIDPDTIETLTDMDKEMEVLSQATIIVVSIDVQKPCYMINQLCVNLDIPAIYGGVYPGGNAGQTVIVPHPKEQCYHCSQKMMGALDYKGHSPDGDYGIDPMSVQDDGVVTAVPALKYSISAVASDMAAGLLDILSGVAVPEVLVQTQSWEDILNIPAGENLKAVAGMVAALPNLGLVSSMKITPNKGSYVLSVKQGKVGQKLRRWNSCPVHGSSNSLSDI